MSSVSLGENSSAGDYDDGDGDGVTGIRWSILLK
jgi:hypothetical protein